MTKDEAEVLKEGVGGWVQERKEDGDGVDNDKVKRNSGEVQVVVCGGANEKYATQPAVVKDGAWLRR